MTQPCKPLLRLVARSRLCANDLYKQARWPAMIIPYTRSGNKRWEACLWGSCNTAHARSRHGIACCSSCAGAALLETVHRTAHTAKNTKVLYCNTNSCSGAVAAWRGCSILLGLAVAAGRMLEVAAKCLGRMGAAERTSCTPLPVVCPRDLPLTVNGGHPSHLATPCQHGHALQHPIPTQRQPRDPRSAAQRSSEAICPWSCHAACSAAPLPFHLMHFETADSNHSTSSRVRRVPMAGQNVCHLVTSHVGHHSPSHSQEAASFTRLGESTATSSLVSRWKR